LFDKKLELLLRGFGLLQHDNIRFLIENPIFEHSSFGIAPDPSDIP
jgi:hypothetical protein